MARFIVLTFLFLGIVFYEMSGGADFRPRQAAAIADATPDPVTTPPTPEPTEAIAPADDTPEASPPADSDAPVAEPVPDLGTTLLASADAAVVPDAPVLLPAPPLEFRRVNATGVNVRAGPGTDFNVVEKVGPGDSAAVVFDDVAAGWVQVRINATGTIGWIAAPLLSPLSP
ncbi:MAG: SH3 domain-containing protein [Limimaricola sp.]|nr:SH3 domain-containing protein [Limimaricola sp.]